MLVGIVLLVLGALDIDSDRGKPMLVLGMALGSLGGLDTALREHFAGYRSHTTVIASLPAVTTAALAYFVGVPWPVVVVAAAARLRRRVLVDATGLHAQRPPCAPGARLPSTPWRRRSACSSAGCTTSRRSAGTWSGRSRSTATCSAS